MSDTKIDRLKLAIKKVLKQKKYSYQDLADFLECSVPTIKRVLGPDELTLSRMLLICDYLGLTLTDLEAIAGNIQQEKGQFTRAQQNFLVKNRGHLSYLLSLYSGMTPKEIAKKYALTKLSQDKYLVALEKMELIKVTGKGVVKTSFPSMPDWGAGPIAKAYFEGIIDNSSKFYKKRIAKLLLESEHELHPKGKIPEGFSTFGLKLSEQSYRNWAKEQMRHLDELHRISELEEKSIDNRELRTAVVVVAHSFVEHDDPNLKILEDIFGDVYNLD